MREKQKYRSTQKDKEKYGFTWIEKKKYREKIIKYVLQKQEEYWLEIDQKQIDIQIDKSHRTIERKILYIHTHYTLIHNQ